MKFMDMAMRVLLGRTQFRAGTPAKPKKHRLNESTVKGDKLARAASRSGSVYGRKTWI